jgi:hypothetical protein
MESLIIENRGAERKYEFENMNVGEKRTYDNCRTDILLNCAKYWAKKNGKEWKFRCFAEQLGTGKVSIVRVK